LTASAGMNAWPSYAPDGRQIAFGSSRSGEFEIYVMDADGANVRRLTRSSGLDARPAWVSGRFADRLHEQPGRKLRNLCLEQEGSEVRNLTTHPSRDDHPTWHPDGRRLLFVSDRDGGSDLYLVRVP